MIEWFTIYTDGSEDSKEALDMLRVYGKDFWEVVITDNVQLPVTYRNNVRIGDLKALKGYLRNEQEQKERNHRISRANGGGEEAPRPPQKSPKKSDRNPS